MSDIVKDASGRLWLSTWRSALRYDPAVGPTSLVNYGPGNAPLANGNCRDLDLAPDGSLWFALVGYGGAQGGLLRYIPSTNNWHYWTGGAAPQGGNGWPQLVWSVANVSIQPGASGQYTVWCEAENSAAMVSFDSATQLFSFHDFTYTPGDVSELPGKDCVDDVGNCWMVRYVGANGSTLLWSLDYRTAAGTWVTPPQPPLPAVNPPIWAFKAYGNGRALLADGNSNILDWNGTSWVNLGIWREGAYTNSLDIDAAGNVWVAGTGGAAKRSVATGQWQRYRVTNTSQYDLWNNDLDIDQATGNLYACANAGGGIGGLTMFDGTRWTGWNIGEYGLGHAWPFATDNAEAVVHRANGDIAANPMFNGLHRWNGTAWSSLNGMNRSRGLIEDSNNRLWSLGEYFSLQYLNGATWVNVANNGTWGNNIQRDPSRAGTVWVSTYAEVIRTDGSYRYSRTYNQFPELNTQSDIFGTVAAGPNGTAWMGSTKGMFHLDAVSGTYTYHSTLGGISCLGGSPLAVTPDGRVWYSLFDPYGSGPHGLAWWDGTNGGIFTAPRDGGPQWGGLPHAQIKTMRVRPIAGGYELWMSCLSRGIAVLTVLSSNPTDAPSVDRAPALLEPSVPNPFTASTEIAFALPRATNVSLQIFDAAGRRIRELFTREVNAGRHVVSWDGRNDQGREVESGVYFCRLVAGGQSSEQSVIRIR
ncbi:MAG: FlgD immunoglobulin-like domain containing protein [Candidatus Eisenbacteria bacterium]